VHVTWTSRGNFEVHANPRGLFEKDITTSCYTP